MIYRAFQILILLLASPAGLASDTDKTLSELREAGWHVSEPLTVEKVEAESLDDLRNYIELTGSRRDIPLVPFGLAREEWLEFKGQIEDGDELVKLSSPSEYWASLRGWSGYAIVRAGKVVDSFATMIN